MDTPKAKYGEKKSHTEKTANGTELKFTFQHLGIRETLKFMSRTEGDQEKRVDELLEHVIRYEDSTKPTFEDFEEFEDGVQVLMRVGQAAVSFLVGSKPKTK